MNHPQKSQYEGCFFVPAFSSNHGYKDYRDDLLNIAESGCPLVILNDDAKALKLYAFIKEMKKNESEFDVFLCHNTDDKPFVKDIGYKLLEKGLCTWLDEWGLEVGIPWQQPLEEQIRNSKSAAVFIGKKGIGSFQKKEIKDFLKEHKKRKCPIIPIFCLDCQSESELYPNELEKNNLLYLRFSKLIKRALISIRHINYLFIVPELSKFTWVDFRQDEPDPMEQLLSGITGNKHFSCIKSVRGIGAVYYNSTIGGRIAAKYVSSLYKNANDNLRILLVCSSVHQQRQDEFEKNIRTKYKKACFEKIYADFDRQNAYQESLGRLSNNDNNKFYNIIFCTNDEMALGVLNALSQLKKKDKLTDKQYNDIKVIGYDSIREARELIDIGLSPLKNSVAMEPKSLAEQAAEMLIDMINNNCEIKNECCINPVLYK